MKLTCLLPFQALTESGPLLHFAKEMLLHPREVGAVCPSSPRLAQAMADCIPDGEGLVAELGAGTGVVTEAILSRVPSSELVVLEQSADFCRILRDRYRNVRIIQGDAARLCSYIPQNVPIRAVVSSLPLMNFLRRTARTDIRADAAGCWHPWPGHPVHLRLLLQISL